MRSKINYENIFKKILQDSVNADSDKDISVIYDEHFFQYFHYFSNVVNELMYKVTYIFVPNSYQCVLQNNEKFNANEEIQLPIGINSSINQSDIVLNFLTGNSKSSKVRGSVIQYIKDNGCKVIHCPNISDEIFNLIKKSSFGRVHNDCELMAWALGNSETATILTTGPDGAEAELNIKLGGWGNDPFISSGIILENSWGNVTPGEAFCCPKAHHVNGTIYINGSVPGHIFSPGDYLFLEFTKGKITNSKTFGAHHVHEYFKSLIEEANKRNDKNWDTFAELGIGLNPVIKKLTGNPLFDEKMAGTIHIAIGDNVFFGHTVQSHIHEDLVVLNATLLFDDVKIISKGKLKKDVLRAQRAAFNPRNVDLSETNAIMFKPAKIHIGQNGIKRKINRGKRIGYIEIFKKKHHKIVPVLEAIIKEDAGEVEWSELLRLTKKIVPNTELKKIMETLIHYKMAAIKSKS